MSTILEKCVIDLFQLPNAARIHHQQDGVIVKGSPTDDSKNYTGTLLLVQHPLRPVSTSQCSIPVQTCAEGGTAETESVPQADIATEESKPTVTYVYYLIWASYTFLATHLPHLVSLDIRARIMPCAESLAPSEWSLTMCIALTSIARIERRSNLRGMRIVTVILTDGRSTHPFVFQQGGITKFLEIVKRVSPLRQSNTKADDFILYGDDDVSPSSPLEAANESNLTHFSQKTPNLSTRTIPPGEMHRLLYDSIPSSDRWRYRLATVIHTVRDGVRRSGLPLARSLTNLSPAADDAAAAAAASDGPTARAELVAPAECGAPRLPGPPPRATGPPLTAAAWARCFAGDGRRADPTRLAEARAAAFAGGIDEGIRLEVWLFLLRLYPEDATEAQREEVREAYRRMYDSLTAQWTSVFPAQERRFTAFREVRSAIMKDVVRTDRSHPSYATDESEKQQALRDVLMAYAMFNFDLGYCQGMSDILSVIVLLSESNAEAFTCFSCFLSERCENNFCQDLRVAMSAQLSAVQTLIRHFVPSLYAHLVDQHADDMSFCFRWLLMLFKREFSIDDTMLLWDVLLSCPYTPQFEIFVAAALLKALAPQILQHHLTYDELIKFINGVSGILDVRHVIVLAQDFYDEVAKQTMELDTSTGFSEGNYRPSLSDVLRILRDAEA